MQDLAVSIGLKDMSSTNSRVYPVGVCFACKGHGSLVCVRCQKAYYCTAGCRTDDWVYHKWICRRTPKRRNTKTFFMESDLCDTVSKSFVQLAWFSPNNIVAGHDPLAYFMDKRQYKMVEFCFRLGYTWTRQFCPYEACRFDPHTVAVLRRQTPRINVSCPMQRISELELSPLYYQLWTEDVPTSIDSFRPMSWFNVLYLYTTDRAIESHTRVLAGLGLATVVNASGLFVHSFTKSYNAGVALGQTERAWLDIRRAQLPTVLGAFLCPDSTITPLLDLILAYEHACTIDFVWT